MVFTAYRGSNSWVEPLLSIPWANKGMSAISGPKIHWTFETLFTNLSAVYLPKQTNKAVSWFASNLKNCYDFGPVVEWLIETSERDKEKCGWEQCASLVTPASLRRWHFLPPNTLCSSFTYACVPHLQWQQWPQWPTVRAIDQQMWRASSLRSSALSFINIKTIGLWVSLSEC